jgi:hypothetical protein
LVFPIQEQEEIMMVRTVVRLAVVAVLMAPAIAVAADPVPDMKGRWVGKTHSIVAGKGDLWPSSAGTFDKPGLYEKDLVLEITGQQDDRFWGVTTISGGGEKTQEPFIGELYGKDRRKLLSADTDGYVRVAGKFVDEEREAAAVRAGIHGHPRQSA